MEKILKCSKGCNRYNKTTDEIVEAARKHKETAIVLKQVGEKQKKKIEVYKQQIESKEFELKENESENEKLKKKCFDLEREVVSLEQTLKKKIKDFNQMEEEFQMKNDKLKERVEWLCRKNEMNFREIGQFCWDLEEQKKVVIERNREIEVHERKKTVTDKVIKDLQLEKYELKAEVKALSKAGEGNQLEIENFRTQNEKSKNELLKNHEHVQQLLKQIQEIQTENLVNQRTIEEIIKENEMVRYSLKELEKGNETLKEQHEIDQLGVEDINSLDAELKLANALSENSCQICGETFESLEFLKSHRLENHDKVAWKLKEAALEKQILEQRMKISANLLKMKENESLEVNRCFSRGFCRIFHHKHNWKVSLSRKFAERLESSKRYSCESCRESFQSEDDLKKHVVNDHRSLASE